MGRTNPTFRDTLQRYRQDWSAFRRGLRRGQQPAFDALFADAEAHADAAGLQNAREPMHPILVAMLLEQKLTIRDLEERVADLEAALAETGADGDGRHDAAGSTDASVSTDAAGGER